MKQDTLKHKFAKNTFVKPLYGKTVLRNRVTPIKKTIDLDVQSKLRGRGFKNVSIRKFFRQSNSSEASLRKLDYLNKSTNKQIAYKPKQFQHIVRTASKFNKCNGNVKENEKQGQDSDINVENDESIISYNINSENMEINNELIRNNTTQYNNNNNVSDDVSNSKNIQTNEGSYIFHKTPITWLRMYPAPSLPDEGIMSMVFRCVMCQFGLMALLILWTFVWWIVINHFEEPYEIQVTENYDKEQNQLIIDLATELRQIAPFSSKWRPIIESRIQQERVLTINAVGRGAKLQPGAFWDLSGTFLFTVFVMTALGFGAPVPQTMFGRTSAIVYAALAAPAHIYLMMNLSTCIVFRMETLVSRIKKQANRDLNQPDPHGASSSQSFIKPFPGYCVRQKIKKLVRIVCIGRCVPISVLVYYAAGAACFGYLRHERVLDIIMFPCEFTTTGGLESVSPLVRILYGFYVEGALLLVAIGLAVLKFHNGHAVEKMTIKYRLFTHRVFVSRRREGK